MSGSIFDTLVELMEIPAPTGQEEGVLAWCRRNWAELGAEVTVQPIGNVLARFRANGPRLLLQGHADEISFVVKSIDDRGFVRVADGQSGSRKPHSRYPVGQPALILGRNGNVEGVFATVTGHVMATLPEATPLNENDLFIDLGVDTRAEAEELGVHIGAGVIWNPPTRRIGQHRFIGKAIDNRISIALMTHTLANLDRSALAYDLTVSATVQEEIGLIGAMSLAKRGEFDLAIAIDNGPIADYPGVSNLEIPMMLGAGPALIYKDAWTHYDRRVIDRLRRVSVERNIPLQESIYPGFGSDGAALIRAGIPTALLAIATRYTHAPFEMGDLRDLDGALTLLTAFVTTNAEPLPDGPS